MKTVVKILITSTIAYVSYDLIVKHNYVNLITIELYTTVVYCI